MLFVCTPSLKTSSHAARIRTSLGSGLAAEFTEVEAHVPRETVDAARTLAERHQIEVVVALGGGSAIGVGKGIVLSPSPLAGEPLLSGSRDFPRGQGRGGGSPVLIAIPTTYAGSEMTPVFGTTDRVQGRKSVRRDDAVLPKLAIYDPEVTIDLSAELTASTAMNALAHCVEACYARDVNPIVPLVALEGIRRIVRSLPPCIANGRNLDAREDLLTGAYLAGFSIGNATMALHHGICHVLGGRTGVAHGVLNAIMLPHVMRFNAATVPAAMSAIADAMGAGPHPALPQRGMELSAPEWVAALVASLPVPQRLRDAGVPETILESVAEEAAANPTVRANPRLVSETDLRILLRAAW